MKNVTNIEIGTKVELVKPINYRENIEELIYQEYIPAGRQGEYMGKRRSRLIDVHEEVHPEYINSENMWSNTHLIRGGHVVGITGHDGTYRYLTFKDDEFNEFIKFVGVE